MKKKHSGFTIIEVTLIILVLAVVSFGGYYVWNTQHKTNTATTSTNSSATVPATEYLIVKEWGVKVPISSSTAGLSYKVLGEGTLYSFRDTALDKLSGNCTDNSIFIIRGMASDPVYGETSQIGTFLSEYTNPVSSLSGKVAVKIGSYYYLNAPVPGASCGTLSANEPGYAEADNAEILARTNIEKALGNMVAN